MPSQMDTTPLAWLDEVERQRRGTGLRRSLRTRSPMGAEVEMDAILVAG